MATEEQIQQALDIFNETGSLTQASKETGIPRSTLWSRVKKQSPETSDTTQERITTTEDLENGTLKLFVLSERITTAEQAIQKAGVDLSVYEVTKILIKSWEVGSKVETVDDDGKKVNLGTAVTPLFGIKVELKKKDQRLQDITETLIAEMEKHAPTYPTYPTPTFTPEERCMLEISMPDVHFGARAWSSETGEDYDCDIAKTRFMDLLERLLGYSANYKPERILFPAGSDFLAFDTLDGTTTKGTKQDVDSRASRVFREGYLLLVQAIDRLAEIAPVDVPVIEGNHDRLSMIHLGVVLEAHYRNTDRVSVDNSPKTRKYREYGTTLIGMVHGSKDDPKPDRLPLIMAQEQPAAWSRCNLRTWQLGHFHKSKEDKFNSGDTYNGVSVKVIPSLCSTDAWHYSMGYVGTPKAAEAYIFSYSQGEIAHFTARVRA